MYAFTDEFVGYFANEGNDYIDSDNSFVILRIDAKVYILDADVYFRIGLDDILQMNCFLTA